MGTGNAITWELSILIKIKINIIVIKYFLYDKLDDHYHDDGINIYGHDDDVNRGDNDEY